MANSFCDYLENALLNQAFGAAAWTAPATLYIGLSTTTITDAGGNITEPSGNNYSRLSVTNNTTNFPTTSTGSKSNGVDFTFATPSGSWGTITDWFIADNSTGGNILVYDHMTTSQAVGANNTVKFAASAMTITLD